MTPPKPAPGAGSGARFTLRQLEAFATVVRLGGVSPAAAHLARTQSAVSMAIQDLEGALDTRLFTRRGRRLVPTGAADRLAVRDVYGLTYNHALGHVGLLREWDALPDPALLGIDTPTPTATRPVPSPPRSQAAGGGRDWFAASPGMDSSRSSGGRGLAL